MSLRFRLPYKLKECFSSVNHRRTISPEIACAAPGEEDIGGGHGDWGHGDISSHVHDWRYQSQDVEIESGERKGEGWNLPSVASLETLVETLRCGDREAQASAAELLFNYTADNTQYREDLCALGAVDPLVRMVVGGSVKGRVYAAYTLSTLTTMEESRNEIERSGAIPALVDMLKSNECLLEGKKGALRAIARLARSDSAAVEVVRAGGLDPLVALLSSDDVSLVKRCLIALYFVGADKDDLQEEIVRAGAVPYLLDLCGSSIASIQAEAADVCKVLARSPWCAEVIADEGGIDVLVLVATEGSSKRAEENALKALQRMAESNPLLKQEIQKSGAALRTDDLSDDEIAQLVGIMSSGDQQLREQAAQVIEQVAAGDPRASRDLAEPEIVTSLIDILSTGSEEGRAYAAWAIARLAEDVSVRDIIFVAGAVPPLIGVLRDCEGRGQEGAACALQKLASHKDAAAAIVKEGHLTTFLMALDTGNDRTQLFVARTLFLLRGVGAGVQPQIVMHGGIPVLIRRCWRGSQEVQALGAAVLRDLCQAPHHRRQLLLSGAVPALLRIADSPIPDVPQMSQESLQFLACEDLKVEVGEELELQARVTEMLARVEKIEHVRPSGLIEEALRLIPRGMFAGSKAAVAYNGERILLSELDVELPALSVSIQTLQGLQLQPGHSFLEVGCSTGFLLSLAGYMVAPTGCAIGIESDPVLCAFAESQAEKLITARILSIEKPRFIRGRVYQLFKNMDRFDRIAVSISFPRTLLGELLALLKPFGRMVIPCEGQLLLVREEMGLAGAEVLCPYIPYQSVSRDSANNSNHRSGGGGGGYPTASQGAGNGTQAPKAASTVLAPTPSKIPHPAQIGVNGMRRAMPVSRIPAPQRNSDEEGSLHRSRSSSRSSRSRHRYESDDEKGPSSSRSNRSDGGSSRNVQGDGRRRLRRNSSQKLQHRADQSGSSSNRSNRSAAHSEESEHKEVPAELKGLILSMDDIKVCRNGDGKKCRLGEGGFGMVYKAVMNNVDEVAVKVVKTEKPTAKELDAFLKEVQTLSSLHHRNIVQLYGACLEPGSMFFVTELMRGGDMYSALRNHKETMRWERLGKKVALDVALGVNYLHSQKPPMMHRDLKSPNVLLSEEGVAKIADVGMVRKQVKDLVTAQPVMTPLWAAPEVMRKERASIKADVWSYGILIWELVSGEDITEYQPLAMSRQMPTDKGRIMEIPSSAPRVAKKIFDECTRMVAEERPCMQQIVEWLRQDGR